MPFRISISKSDVQSALTDQGFTATRAGYLDAAISSRAAPGADMGIAAAARAAIWNEAIPATPTAGSFGERVKANLDAAITSRPSGTDWTAARAANLDAAISTRAAAGAAMDLVAAAKTAVWNEAIPATPTAGSYGERLKGNLDAAISSRAAPGAAMALAAPYDVRLDAAVSTRASPTDVDTQLGNRGLTTARMAKLDSVASPVSNTGTVAAAGNTAGLTVSLDTGDRSVVEVRYTGGAAATFYAEGSADNITWYQGETFSESGAVTNKLVGYLNAYRYFRFRSTTTGIDLTFEVRALL